MNRGEIFAIHLCIFVNVLEINIWRENYMFWILLWQFQTISECLCGKRLEKMPKGQTGHSESIWTTSVGKYWKSCKTAKIGYSKSIQNTSVGKYLKSCKTVKIGHSESIWTTLVGKYWKSCKTANIGHYESIFIHFGRKILEKLQYSQNWPFWINFYPLW